MDEDTPAQPARGTVGADETPPAVAAVDLVKRYTKRGETTTAVAGVSLRIQQGETFGILGTNGAGKTTTVEMLAGLRKPDGGTVEILGFDPVADRAAVRQILGVQLQEAALHGSLTCMELIDLYRSFYPDPLGTEEVLALVELTEQRRKRFDDLSGGQQQRLSIALAVLGRPAVVILDELTTGLDPRARRRIWSSVESLEDQTVILVSHAMDEVERLCDRVILLDAGRIVAEGTPEALMQQAGTTSMEDAFVTLTGKELPSDEEDL